MWKGTKMSNNPVWWVVGVLLFIVLLYIVVKIFSGQDPDVVLGMFGLA